ncbi:hypothetical protein EASAB2608_06536 [Streptomyces sp. EAS-AB2608]|uniref:NucA/NucB deoxyribonuclease domain-containing protein n=1 Tax=Streptomyces sp. EAS-AB2608 TaxID=2779671 RepID=UPI001BEDA577|nr:hypothetical protein [Streptomyces sp. EAS-AB2608]BCM71202.1 hypothetical protein EASAB2608_06536 [Streptomyces sp. EAS-AB2608]
MQRFLLGSKHRVAGLSAVTVTLSLISPLGTAQADDAPDSQRVETYVRPLYAEPLTLSQLQQPQRMERLRRLKTAESSLSVLPRETIGKARSYAPRAAQDSAQAPAPDLNPLAGAAGSPAVSLPEPAHSMKLAECIKQLGTKQFYVKSRFAVCSGRQFEQVWIVNGRPVGTSHFDVVVIGTFPKDSRTMTATYHYFDFTAAGNNDARKMGITTNASIPKTWPSRIRITKGGDSLPKTRLWQDLLDGRTIKQTIKAPSGQSGTLGKTKLLVAIYQPNIKLKAPSGWASDGFTGGDIFLLPPRWDEADYLPAATRGGGGAFSVLTSLTYSTAERAPERGVAAHIKKAFTKPGQTQPPFSRKKVPGQNPDAPLTRLYHDTTRRKKNRSRAVYNCTKYFGENYSQGGKKECDEYPFATTYEGAAGSDYDSRQDPKNFSVMPVAKTENGAAGTLLGQYYKLNRVVDGPDDGFMVKVRS